MIHCSTKWQFLALVFIFQFLSGVARIIPNDCDLTVFPDVCEDLMHVSSSNSSRTSGNCGVQQLYGDHLWTLRSDDAAYHNIYVVVSRLLSNI